MIEEEETSDRRLLDGSVSALDAPRNADGNSSGEVVLHPTFRAYLYGQFCHALKVSLWWTGLSPLGLALVGHESVIGAIRVAFNVALFLFSPFAGVVAERIPIQQLLAWTTLVRGVMYAVILPLAWLFLKSGLVWLDSEPLMYGFLVALCFVDGIQVACANVLDIDMGGSDLLASQKKLVINDAIRNKLNSIYQIVFDGSFLVFTPTMALLAWYIGVETTKDKDDEEDVEAGKAGALVTVFALVFLVTTVVSMYFYTFGLNAADGSNGDEDEDGVHEYDPLNPNLGSAEDEIGGEDDLDQPSNATIWQGVFEGAKLCWTIKPIRWRLIFLGLEIALEDAVVAVVATEYAHTSRYFGDGDPTKTNLYTALIIAVGKLGALAAGYIMHSFWEIPTTKAGFRPLFYSVFLSSLSVCLLLVSHNLEQSKDGDSMDDDINLKSPTAILSRFLVFLSITSFFFFSTAPKIGFETLLQGMACSVEGSGKIFGFVGPFVSIMDSIVVMSISLAFTLLKEQCEEDDKACTSEKFGDALLITCGIFLVHGLFESLVGPKLMLPNDQTMMQNLNLQ